MNQPRCTDRSAAEADQQPGQRRNDDDAPGTLRRLLRREAEAVERMPAGNLLVWPAIASRFLNNC